MQEAERHAELELARQVQATFLPEPDAEHGPLRIQAFLEQATGIGGDCYFFHAPQPDLLLVGVGDVTGKGSSAALDMARLTTQIELAAARCTPESFTAWLVELNNVLYEAMHADDNAVALTVLLFDLDRRRVHAATFAQHAPLYRAHADRDVARGGLSAPRLLWAAKLSRVPRHHRSAGGRLALAPAFRWHHGGGDCGRGSFPDGLGLLKLPGRTNTGRPDRIVEALIAKWNAQLVAGARDDATLLLIEDRTATPHGSSPTLCTPASIRDARLYFEQWLAVRGIRTR